MTIFVDPKTGEKFENDAPDAEVKAEEFGLVTQAAYEAEQRSGGFIPTVQAVGEEAVRQVVGGIQAAQRAIGQGQQRLADAGATPGLPATGAVDPATGLPVGAVGTADPTATIRSATPGLLSPEALERREVNPIATGLGATAPSVAASLFLPGSGAAGLAATLGIDSISGIGQAAVDAELENREISGEDVLRNAGLNLAFSLPLYGLGEGARVALQGRRISALERAASAAKDTAGQRAAAAEGADLARAAADPAVQADLLDRVASNTDDAVSRTHSRLEGVAPPVVARNPRAQREAVGAIADVVRTADPDLAARLDGLTKGSSRKRLEGLRAIRDELASAGESDTLTAIEATIGREDLWGSKAIRGSSDLDAAIGARPAPGAAPEDLIDYAAKVRSVRSGEFAGLADEIEQLAERQIEIRTASAIGDVAPQAANDAVDYAAAMRAIDPNEAWRLTQDGADEGLRRLESASVSDALQRVDDVLREDVAMAVKREDFVKGAESWTPAQIEKQGQWGADMRGRAMALAGKLADAETLGYRIGGFRAEATSLIDRTVQRLAEADPVTVNHEWDNLKRGLDSLGKRLAATGPSIDEASKVWGSKAIIELADDMRRGLEDAELWGRNAGLQKETNAAWVNIIDPYSRVTKRMSEFLGRQFGVVGQAGIRRRFDPDMIESIMKGGYQRNLRADIDASVDALDQMMRARQSQGLSHLERLSKAREDLVRIRQGFDFADLLAVAKSKAKAPLGLEIAERVAGNAAPGGIIGSVAGPIAARARGAIVGELPMLTPGSKSPLAAAVRRHLGLTRGEQAAMLADPAFYERLPGSLQRQIMAGGAGGDRAVEMASVAADAAKRDRELTARLMVNPEDAKRAKKLRRKKATPAVDRARARVTQSGSVSIGAAHRIPLDDVRVRGSDGLLERASKAQAKQHAADIERVASDAFARKSLDDLGALPIDEGDTASRAKIDAFKRDREFTSKGMLPSNNDRGRGGLPALSVDADGSAYLSNGRHRFTAARESGQEWIVANVKRYDTNGDTVWDYVGPVRINSPGGARISRHEQAIVERLKKLKPGTVEHSQLSRTLGRVRERGAERGMVDVGPGQAAKSIATSPLGVGAGAAGAVVAYHHLAEPAAPDPESMTALQRFSDGYDRPIDAFRAARKMILDWQQNPDALIEMIAGHIGDVGQLSPKLEREMTAQAMRIAGYLQDNLPGQRNVSVVYPDGTPPSRAEVRQFALRFGAAVDPAGVLADARAGRIERTQLETLQALWPREYDALRAGVIQELGGGRATPQTRQRMSLLFGFPSGVDPALGPRTRAVVAAARGAQESRARAPRGSGMNRQRLPSTATMQPAGMAALSLGAQIGAP